MKHLLRTILLSILLFLILIFLGLKYHWVSYLHTEKVELKKTLELPENEQSFSQSNVIQVEEVELFEPEIVEITKDSVPLENMTKAQVIDACGSLYDKTSGDGTLKEIFVGNCVVSNYQESYQEINIEQKQDDALHQKKREQARRKCLQQQPQTGQFDSLDSLLLIGICISNLLE